MITRAQKEEKVKEIAEDLKSVSLVVLTDYRGLNVSDINLLRRDLREKDCKYKVVKNKLSKLAAREAGYEDLNPFFEGPTAIAFNDSDPIEVTKTLLKWAKESDSLSLKAGLLDGRIVNAEDLETLGKIPSKEVLLAQVCGGFQAPIFGLVMALQGNIYKLVNVIDNIRRDKEVS